MDFINHPFLIAGFGLLAGTFLGLFLRKVIVEGNEKNIKTQSKQIIENAIVEADQVKKEALIQSKESAYQVKQALKEELNAERDDLKDEQRQLKRKRDSLKREWDGFDRKQTDLQSPTVVGFSQADAKHASNTCIACQPDEGLHTSS